MKRSIPSIILFLIILYVPSLLYFTRGEDAEGLLDEKRELSTLPQEFHNNYFSLFEDYYNDHAPYRLSMITFEKKTRQKLGGIYRNYFHPWLSAVFEPRWYNEDEAFLAPLEEDRVIYGRNDWLFYTGDNSIGYYKGNNLLSEEELSVWVETFFSLKQLCENRGIQLVFAAGPNKEIVYSEKMPSYNIENIPRREERIASTMQTNGLIYVYPLEALLAGKDKFETYYQQDTHWNNVGGFIAVMEIYRFLGIPTTELVSSMITTSERTGGDLSNFCGYATSYPNYTVTYKPEITYSVETYNDGRLEVFSSTCRNGRTIIVISDSFRNACKEYFTKDFEKVVVLHRSMVEDELVMKAVRELKEDDVLLIMPVERYDNSSPQMARLLTDMLGS